MNRVIRNMLIVLYGFPIICVPSLLYTNFPIRHSTQAHANESHYFSGRALGSCIIYHQLTCRNSMIICTHSKSQAIFTRPDYNINLFPSYRDFHSALTDCRESWPADFLIFRSLRWRQSLFPQETGDFAYLFL